MKLLKLVDPHFPTWYRQGLPPSLIQALAGSWQPCELPAFDGTEVDNFCSLLTKSLLTCHNPLLAYHGIDHAQRVVDRGEDVLDAFERHTGERFPPGLVQAVLLGLSQHDRGHPGTTFFADARPSMIPADADSSTSVEWYSANLLDGFLAEADLSPMQRLVAVYTVWSSTYGGAFDRGKQMSLDRIKPRGLIGCLMRAVDVAVSDDFVTGIHGNIRINYGEVPVTPAATTMEGFLQDYAEFLNYVYLCYNRLDHAADFELAKYLGWRSTLARRKEVIKDLQEGGLQVKRAVILSQLEASGVNLV